MGKIVKERLRLRARPGGISIDRWINFVVGDVDAEKIAALRGAVFEVEDVRAVQNQMKELRDLAREARDTGREQEFLLALDGGGEAEAVSNTNAVTFGEFAKEWEEVALVADNVTAAELESSRSILKLHLVPFFGQHRLVNVDRRLIDRYKAEKRSSQHQYGTGYSASSINNQLSVLRRVLSRAVDYGLIERLPMDGSVWMRTDRVEDDENWLPAEEERQLMDFLWDHRRNRPHRHLALLTQLTAGLRFSEMRALEKSDLDVQAGGLHIRRSRARQVTGAPKNKHARFQPLPDELVKELQRYMLTTEGQLLFPGARGGYLPNNVLNRWLRAACRDAGVREVSSHGLRRTAGSSYGFMGAGQKAIASMLGHRDTKATERYVRVHESHRRQLVDARWNRTCGGDET